MMIRHWAPTILDGYAYYGRPQKPRRLILSCCLTRVYISGRTRLMFKQLATMSHTLRLNSTWRSLPSYHTVRA
ncbi:hypothetical protein P153DRAFT_219855 [Dothidotthia symphoricarpi CBS 119687]|uniref:Uncharacterized protein n=1 Tax=Dothidotthia symphoricarpi CBS 119687 TaxID=1392245 RepID=A0A6A6AHG5_9PLEO|nr:uncharacterized protein P153DRAFT_219855 [Dothidotthia symphoricarpi CBS 119687]KAF2130518.1 hypothetical protein P153DRAFT_219855 [Dothidotthia symphoricarpi CBS 119687]